MAREDLHFRLRIPEDLKLRIEQAAAESHRSMTAEIVSRLEESFSRNDEKPKIIIRNLVSDLQATDKFNPDSIAHMEALMFLEDIPHYEIGMTLHLRDLSNSLDETYPGQNHDKLKSITKEMEHRTVARAVKFLLRMGFKITPPPAAKE